MKFLWVIFACAALLADSLILRVVLLLVALYCFARWRPSLAQTSLKPNESRVKSSQSSGAKRVEVSSLPAERLIGKGLLVRRTELLREHNEQEVAAMCGYYLRTGEKNYRIDLQGYLKAVADAHQLIKQQQTNKVDNSSRTLSVCTESPNECKKNKVIVNEDCEIILCSQDIQALSPKPGDTFYVDFHRNMITLDLVDKSLPQNKNDLEIDYDALWQYFQDGGGDIWNEGESVYLGSLDPGPEGGDYFIEVNGPREYGVEFCKNRDDLPRLVQDFVKNGGTVSSIKKAMEVDQATIDTVNETASDTYSRTRVIGGANSSILITIIEAGGEFTCGTVDDPNLENIIKDKINDQSMTSCFDTEYGGHFDISNHNNIISVYGPHVPGSILRLEISEESGGSYKECFEGPISDSGACVFESSTPYAEAEDKMILFNKKIEKRIHYSSLFGNHMHSSFDLGNLYIGCVNMDESFGTPDEILECILYIPLRDIKEYYEEYYGEPVSEGEVEGSDVRSELLSEIFKDKKHRLAEKITRLHGLSCLKVEGKGEWECDYIKVSKDDPWNVLYEAGDY